MLEPSVRTEQWAVIDSKDKIRLIFDERDRAQSLCDRFHHISMDNGPFRVATLYVVEMVEEEPTPPPPRKKKH